MELINNRYKVEKLLNKDIFEDYLVEDSHDNNKKVMRIIDGNIHRELVEYYTNEFLWVKNIKHKRILNVEAFGIIKTINLRQNESPLYYITSEKSQKKSLDQLSGDLILCDIIKIVQELMSVIDYLHFRGFTYKYLDPKKIFYSKDRGIKLLNLNSIIEDSFSKKNDPFNEEFITQDALLRRDTNNLTDLYSIGMIMRYLLLDKSEDFNLFIFKEGLKIGEEDKEYLKDIIIELIDSYRNNEDISLVSIIDKLNNISGQEYIHNFKEDREHLYLKTKLIGREDELEYIKGIDQKTINNCLDFNGLLIRGISGVGKTRLVKEISFRLRLKSRIVYDVNVDQSLSYELDIIKIFLNIITKNVEDEILSRYRSSFIDFIPNKYGGQGGTITDKPIQRIELYKLFNSICNFLKELSLSKPVYIIIDNINKYNETFIHLIDYLLQSLLDSKIFIIFTDDGRFHKKSLYYNLEKWTKEGFIEEIVLNNLTREDISILTQNILGISFAPSKLASVFYDVSKGNPRFLDLTIKEIFSKKELYISDKGKWYSDKDNYTDLSLPTDFRKTIIDQTKDMSGDKLNVLKVISISNESISKFLIYNMLDYEMVDLNSIINSLLNEQVLVERNYNNNFYYGFLSNELKATIYYDMDDRKKIQLHRQLAGLLLYYKPNMIMDLVEETSYHLIKAKERENAIELVIQEAEKIENIYNERAISLWEMAFSIISNIDNKYKLYVLDILTKINLHKSNENKLNSYLTLFKKEAYKLNDVKYIIKSFNYEAEIYLRNNDFLKLNKTIEEIERLSFENNSPEGLILLSIVKVRLLNKDTEIDRLYMKELLDQALELSSKNNIKDYLGQIYLLYGSFKYINGESNQAVNYYKQSIKYLEENGEIYDTIKVINNLGNVYLEDFGNRERCFEYLHQGLEITIKYEFTHLEPILLHNIGDIYLNMIEFAKSKDYTNRSLQVANTNKDIDMIVMSNCNLGRIYILTNEYDKAYETYIFLKDMIEKEQITVTEIVIAYENFLGLFYYAFGEFDKGFKYSKLASEMAYNLSENDYFTSTFRMYHIDYLRESLDKHKFYNFLQDYNKENINEMYNWSLLSLGISALLKDDIEFAKNLKNYYFKSKNKEDSGVFTYIDNIINPYIIGNSDNLLIIEDEIKRKEKVDVFKVSFKYYLLLAMMFSKFDQKKMALKYYIKTFDYIYYSIYSIEDIELKRLFILKYDIDGIKRKINDILNYLYNVKIPTLKIDDFTDSNLNSYFDLRPLVKSLNNDEISDIVGYWDIGIESIDQLISNFGIDYKVNVQLVLNYLAKATLANRGFILTIENGIIDLDNPLVSLVEGDSNLPNEIILYQSLKQENGFLFNFNFTKKKTNKYFQLSLPANARGIICIPIKKYDDKALDSLQRSYQGQEGNLHGYLYLETDNVLNRFDEESLKLVFSLSRLISLNLDNEKLRKNSARDKITSVYTREYFEAQFDGILEVYKKKQGELSVLMIDIDRFKGFNDKYGHVKGDEILAKVGKGIKHAVDSNGITGRYGGEEFIVLLWDCTIDKAIMFAENIRKNVEKTYIPGVEDTVTVSIGLAQFPIHGNYIMDLINSADQALYYAKEVLFRNSIAVWHKDLQNTNPNIDKTKGIVSGNIAKDNRNILQLMDIAESIKEDKDIVDKIYQLLSSIITISECEYATFVDYSNGKINNYYTRKRGEIEWVEKKLIHMNLINEVYNSKTGLCTIDWHDKSKDYLHVPDWDSLLFAPIIKKDLVQGILYLSVPLKEREFNQETMNVINMFANIFSGNY